MERYFLINKQTAERSGLNSVVRTEIEGSLLLSEKDLMNITLTTDERVKALGGAEYIDKTEVPAIEPEIETTIEEPKI